MNEPTIKLESAAVVPYLDQWMGEWFIEPRRGQTLHRAISHLNIGVHLQDVEQRGNRNDTAPPPPAIDFEQPPRTRAAYQYRNTDGVAILEINGALMKHQASAMESTSTTMMRRSVRKAMHDDAVKAIIFMIDSPGGTVAGIYELASDIAALSKVKPCFAHCSNICASAAYLLASQMRSISATQSTLVGSLGTYGVVYDTSRAYEDAGIKAYLLKGNINGKKPLMKGAGEEGVAISEPQLARMQENVDDFNQQFYEAVVAGPRKPKRDAVESWFVDAGVWISPKAKTMGLIDRVESFDQMLARVSGKAQNAGDTVPSESIEPTDDTTETKRRSDSTSLVAQSGDLVDPKQIFGQLMEALDERIKVISVLSPNNEAGGMAAGDSHQAEDVATENATGSAAVLGKESDMSQTNTDGGASTATASAAPEPKPATIAELKAAFPKDPAFALDAAEKALTLTEAKAAYADVLAQRLEASQKEVTDLKAVTPAAPAATAVVAKPVGVKPTASKAAEASSSSAAGGDEDPIAIYESRVADLLKSRPSMQRHEAAQKVLGEDEALRDAYTEAKAAERQGKIAQQQQAAAAMSARR
jgi:ClpP class serine protease